MTKHNISCIFCEDIRHEQGGKISLMGCFHKALKIPTVPCELIKLCVHITIVLDDDTELNDASVRLMLNGKERAEYSFEKNSIEMVGHDTNTPTHIIAGLQIPRFNIDELGTIDVLVTVNGQLQKAGSLKIISDEAHPPSKAANDPRPVVRRRTRKK